MLSTRKWVIATKFSLICLNEEMFMTAMEKLVQVTTIDIATDFVARKIRSLICNYVG